MNRHKKAGNASPDTANARRKPRFFKARRAKYSNRLRVFCCYLTVFAGFALILLLCMNEVYPTRLAATAPNILEQLEPVMPNADIYPLRLTPETLKSAWSSVFGGAAQSEAEQQEPEAVTAFADMRTENQTTVQTSAAGGGLSRQERIAQLSLSGRHGAAEILAVYRERETPWKLFVGLMMGAAAFLSYLLVLLWRRHFKKPYHIAQTSLRAVRGYRILMAVILLLNMAGVFVVYKLGFSHISGVNEGLYTVWDVLFCFWAFAYVPVTCWFLFRFAGPASITGKNCFFHRI